MNILVLSCESQREVEAFINAIESCSCERAITISDAPTAVDAYYSVTYKAGYCYAELELVTWSCKHMAHFERAIAHLV